MFVCDLFSASLHAYFIRVRTQITQMTEDTAMIWHIANIQATLSLHMSHASVNILLNVLNKSYKHFGSSMFRSTSSLQYTFSAKSDEKRAKKHLIVYDL